MASRADDSATAPPSGKHGANARATDCRRCSRRAPTAAFMVHGGAGPLRHEPAATGRPRRGRLIWRSQSTQAPHERPKNHIAGLITCLRAEKRLSFTASCDSNRTVSQTVSELVDLHLYCE